MHTTKNSLIHQEKEDAHMQSEKRRQQSKEGVVRLFQDQRRVGLEYRGFNPLQVIYGFNPDHSHSFLLLTYVTEQARMEKG
jgi:hypothetical protein